MQFLLTLVPAPYRILAIGLLAAALVGFGYVKGMTHTINEQQIKQEKQDQIDFAVYKDKVGKFFDGSKKRNQPFQFRVGAGQVIRGWDVSLADMKVGETRVVVLPPAMAYGSQNVGGGLIPANSTLIFEIEVLAAA